jgi:putative spermidine/putrescine transport system ATP-binding protein
VWRWVSRWGGRILPCLADACEGDVDYIIRPEKIGFVQTDPILRGNVAARLFLGHHWLFQIQTDLGLIQVTQANVELPAVAEGDEVGLSWRTEHARVITRNLS